MYYVLLFIFVCAGQYILAEDSAVYTKQENGYAFYYPLTMSTEQNETVCLAINKSLLPAKVYITFGDANCNEATCKSYIINSDHSCWQVKVPNIVTNQIKIKIETKDKYVTLTGSNEVEIIERQKHIFIETDRSVYKPGDLVRIRLLVLGFDLKALEHYKVPLIEIKSPSSTIVTQWKDVETELGLVQLEFQLAPDTPEGIWWIGGSGISNSFEVKKYVLPRFQATIIGADTVYSGSETISYTVCAKYSYGRNVKGEATLQVTSMRYGTLVPVGYASKIELKNGCAKFEIPNAALGLQQERPAVWSLQLKATVTENGTGQQEVTEKNVQVNRRPFDGQFNSKTQLIKPELPYTGKFSVININVPIQNMTFELCYFIDWQIISCSNFTTDSNNIIEFTVPPLKNIAEDSRIYVQAKNFDYPFAFKPETTLIQFYSKSRNAIQIEDLNKEPRECGSILKFKVLYNSKRFDKGEEIEFKYILSSRGELLSIGTIVDEIEQDILNLGEYQNVIGKDSYEVGSDDFFDKFELTIKLDGRIYASSELFVYYEYKDEVISDVIHIEVKKCAPNKVEAQWMDALLYPGETGSLAIKTDSGSLCAVSSVDKASTFLGTNSNIKMDNILHQFQRNAILSSQNCVKATNLTEEEEQDTGYYLENYSVLYDSRDALANSNLGVISNLKFLTKPCKKLDFGLIDIRVEEDSYHGDTINEIDTVDSVNRDDRGSAVRSFFPETWLWDLIPIKNSGEITVQRTLPDSITDWVGNVVCVSPNTGFGKSNDIEIRGFKPFFVDVLLPYSIKRNKEVLHLPVPIFNYLNHSLPIRITLKSGEDLMLVDQNAKRSLNMCIEAENSYTHTYLIKASKLGFVNVIVEADVDPVYVENCAPKSVIRRRDVVQKSLRVEPEGYPSGLLKSILLCANDPTGIDNVEWNIILPEHVVLDTVDGKVTINSDIMGPVFQNLENILVVPTGCGEQTMATLTPNLYVLKYLEANNELSDEIKNKILRNLKIGYQRMLNYLHKDGSFSAFGIIDRDGSMFLTAFVIRTFKQMQKYIFIDDKIISAAVKWIAQHQLENGCFDPVQHVFHEMGLATSKNQTTALTSYVLISLLESNMKIDDEFLSKAKECIVNDNSYDKYTIAISSYALGLMNESKIVENKLNKLLELSSTKDDLRWWAQSETSESDNVEASSYVLMSLLQQNSSENLGIAGSVVRWLQSKMNPTGGFFSTTDTVVGLDSISRYAILVNRKRLNVKVSITVNNVSKNFDITQRQRTITEELPLTTYPSTINAKIKGDGCVSVQAIVNYYLDKPVSSDALKLDITSEYATERKEYMLIEVKPCVSYEATGHVNMAIVEVGIPSGFAADYDSLSKLRSENVVKKFEQIKNKIVFYLTQLGADRVCLPFMIDQNVIVENVANATVKLYDYYKPELSVSKSFNLPIREDQ